MAKKKEFKIVKPIEALESLTEYHNNVITLVMTAKAILPHIPEMVRGELEASIKRVDQFYSE